MSPFLVEHRWSLTGSALLHLALLAGVLAAAFYHRETRVETPPVIEAYLAPSKARDYVQPLPAAPAETPSEVTSPPPAPKPEPKIVPKSPPKPLPNPAPVQKPLVKAEPPKPAAKPLPPKPDPHAQTKAQRQEEDELAREVAAEADRRRAETAAQRDMQRRIDAENRDRAARDAAQKAAAAQAVQRDAQMSAALDRYVAEVKARITRAWNRPASARPGTNCKVDVTQVAGGTVTNAKVVECNGDAAVVESIRAAVYKASPLPAPPDPKYLSLRIEFKPDE